MIIPAFTTIFPTDIFLFCVLLLFYAALAAVGVVVLICLYQLLRMGWYAITGRWHVIEKESEEAKERLRKR